jgi:cell wall-associated NlpC family hydrolase
VERIDISSFSAGYGAVREIVQVPEYVKLIRRIVLADSLYAGWDPATTQPGATSRPAAENIDPWQPFVEAAARGEKTFVLTHSQVPTSYANTEACAKALIELVGAQVETIDRGALPATLDPDFPLLYRACKGNFHVWGYGGVDAQAHMTHPRHIAEVWRALDEADAAQASEIRRGMSMRDPPEVRQRKYFENLARQIEPELTGDIAKLDVYLRFFERAIVRERRLFAFNVAAQARDGKVVLSGQAEYPQQARSLVMLLQTLGLAVEDQIEPAPTKALGDTPYGIVRAARSFIHASPQPHAEVVNEVLRGETLYLLHAVEGERPMYWCHAPDGYVGWIRAEDVERVDGARLAQALSSGSSSPDPRVEAVIASAQSKLGLPYVWGGRSDIGVDCSGLVQTAFASHGVHLPRDAEQQAIVGKLVATRWHRDALRRGDVLFFMGRRGAVSHTAIYLGDDQYIEASGSVKFSSFRADDDGHSRSRDDSFCFAKRIIE